MIFDLFNNLYDNFKNFNKEKIINKNFSIGGSGLKLNLNRRPSSQVDLNIPPPLPPTRNFDTPSFTARRSFSSTRLPSRTSSMPSSYPSRNEFRVRLPPRSNTISTSTPSSNNIPNEISTSELSPENSKFSDGIADEVPGLIIICCILLFFTIILVWIMTEERVKATVGEEKKKKKKVDPKNLKVKTSES